MSNSRDILILGSGYSEQVKLYESESIEGDPLWISRLIVTNPDALKKTQIDILKAGVDFLLTMTYQSSIDGYMKQFGLSEEKSYEYMKGNVQETLNAWTEYVKVDSTTKKPSICGSIGSYGAYLHDGSEYTGAFSDNVTKQQLKEFHRPRFDALIEGGSDFIAFETIPCKKEAEVLIELLSEHPEKQGWISFSCRDDGQSISSGERFKDVAKYCYDLNPKQLIAVGVNCLQPVIVESLIKGMNDQRTENPIPLIVYPNSGEMYTQEIGYIGKELCTPIETYVKTWLDLGVKIIGCCCRTDVNDLKKIIDEVKNWKEAKKANGI